MRKENNLKGERGRGVRDGIVGLGLSRGILRTGLPSLPFFRCRRLKLGLEQIRSAYNMGIIVWEHATLSVFPYDYSSAGVEVEICKAYATHRG